MRIVTFLLFIGLCLFGAKLSIGTEKRLNIKGILFKDNCAYITIQGRVVGTKDDGNGTDYILFKIYNDGNLVKKISTNVPVLEAKELNLSFQLQNFQDTKSPGIAIECDELGIYIDPFYLKKSNESCEQYFKMRNIHHELDNICPKLQFFGIHCN